MWEVVIFFTFVVIVHVSTIENPCWRECVNFYSKIMKTDIPSLLLQSEIFFASKMVGIITQIIYNHQPCQYHYKCQLLLSFWCQLLFENNENWHSKLTPTIWDIFVSKMVDMITEIIYNHQPCQYHCKCQLLLSFWSTFIQKS